MNAWGGRQARRWSVETIGSPRAMFGNVRRRSGANRSSINTILYVFDWLLLIKHRLAAEIDIEKVEICMTHNEGDATEHMKPLPIILMCRLYNEFYSFNGCSDTVRATWIQGCNEYRLSWCSEFKMVQRKAKGTGKASLGSPRNYD